MLTQKQYLAKHKLKFDAQKLTLAQRQGRYRAYVNQQKAPTQRSTAKERSPKRPTLAMSDCAAAYAHALIDPFDATESPCIPDSISIPSFKNRVYARGIFATGTAGTAVITLDPWLFGTSEVGCFISNSSYPGTGYTNPNNDPTGYTPVVSTGIITPAVLTDLDTEGRLVSSGIRVRYVGPELTRAGLVIKYRDPANQFIGNSTAAQLLSFQESSTNAVDRKWHYVMYRPARTVDLAYTRTQFQGGAELTMLIMITGATPATSFEFEVVSHLEWTGRGLPGLTPSYADPTGMAIVQSSIGASVPTSTPSAAWETFKAKAFEVAQHTLTQVATNVVGSMLPTRAMVPQITDL